MAHVGEEVAFSAVSSFGGVFGFQCFLFRTFTGQFLSVALQSGVQHRSEVPGNALQEILVGFFVVGRFLALDTDLKPEQAEYLHMVKSSADALLTLLNDTVLEQQDSISFLVAEDNTVNQKLISRLLEKRGHTVVVAQNGREALQALQNQSFDVVLMDGQMPEMDGFEATKKIREAEINTGNHLPIIALTAHAMQGDKERFLACGMDAYVSKPINLEELFAVIAKVVPNIHPSAEAKDLILR